MIAHEMKFTQFVISTRSSIDAIYWKRLFVTFKSMTRPSTQGEGYKIWSGNKPYGDNKNSICSG